MSLPANDKNRAARSCAGPLRAAAESRPGGSFPTVGDFFAMLGIVLGMQFVVGAVALAAGFFSGSAVDASDPALRGARLAAVYVASMLPAYLLVLAYRHYRGGRGPVGRFALSGWNPALLVWAFVFMLAVGVVCEPLFDLLPEPADADLGRGGWTLFSVLVAAPVLEELLCRGVVLESLRGRYGTVAAWFFSSLFFGVLHGQLLLAVNAFVIGAILGYIYLVTGSLWASMLLHALNNAAAYLLMAAGLSDTLLIDLVGSRTLYAIIYIGALAVTAVSAWMMRRTLSRLRAGAEKEPAAQ